MKQTPFYKPVAKGKDFVSKKDSDFEYGYYEDEPLWIYMDLRVALDYLYDSAVSTLKEDGITTYSCPNGVDYIIDPDDDTIVVTDYDKSNLYSSYYGAPLGLIDTPFSKMYIDDLEHSLTTHDVTFDLGAYGLDIVSHGGAPFVPFSVVNKLTFNQAFYSPVCFNGTGFYLLDMLSGAFSLSHNGKSYMEEYYSGANRGKKREGYFVEKNYYALLFDLDHFYGFSDERFSPFEEYLNEYEPEIVDGLLSEDETVYDKAVEKLMNVVIGDGHTSAGRATSTFGEGSYQTTGESSDRQKALNASASLCRKTRTSKGVEPNVVRYSGNTAIISIDSFIHANEEITTENLSNLAKDNKDSFALLSSSMKEIKEEGDVENVIIDITCNGGGDSNALMMMLGLLSNDYRSISYDPLSKGYADIHYKVDTNLDGSFDEDDSYEGDFDFFILTSNFSFSCANMFSHLAKENGMATIIGMNSGGGACVVDFAATPDGRPYRISGNSRTGFLDDPARHDDLGVEVDFELDIDDFYDDVRLNDFVNSLS